MWEEGRLSLGWFGSAAAASGTEKTPPPALCVMSYLPGPTIPFGESKDSFFNASNGVRDAGAKLLGRGSYRSFVFRRRPYTEDQK